METLEKLPYLIPWFIYFIIALLYSNRKIPKFLQLDDYQLSDRNKKILNYGLQQLLVVGLYFITIKNLDINEIGIWTYYYLIFIPGACLTLWISGWIIDLLVATQLIKKS